MRARLRAEVARGRRCGLLLVTEMTPLKMAEDDMEPVAASLSEVVGAPARYVGIETYSRDGLDALDRCLEAVALSVRVDRPTDPQSVAVIGHGMTRAQEDERADAAVLEDLLRGLGLRPCPTWFSGEPFDALGRAAGAGYLVALPSGLRAAEVLAR